jgi:predicted GNAT superfamily acetyltransferase
VIVTRLLHEMDDLAAASALVFDLWHDDSLAPVTLLRANSHFGNPVLGAYDNGELCGVAIGFLAAEPDVHLHSHVTCVLPSHQHAGVGFELKQAQRAWCAEHGIGSITWTFDPMLARNAYFNLHKLGAVARCVLPNFYGELHDDINRGERSDRLEVWWPVAGDAPRGETVRTVALSVVRADTVRELDAAFADGLIATDFRRDEGYCFSR